MQTTYRLHPDNTPLTHTHETTNPQEAQAWSEAGFRVTARMEADQ